MTHERIPDLGGICAEVATELDEVTRTDEADTTAYARGGATFARVSATALSVRLPVDIAEAALNTPDTSLDPGDRGWLVFAPATMEPHVVDRASAWFTIAWKHADDV
jgi:hypothetical protein